MVLIVYNSKKGLQILQALSLYLVNPQSIIYRKCIVHQPAFSRYY